MEKKMLNVRIPAEDLAAVKARAERRGMTVQEYVHAAVLREDRLERFLAATAQAAAAHGHALSEVDEAWNAEHGQACGNTTSAA
jgi:hypothetical protein